MSSYSLTQAPEAPYMHPFPNYPYILLRRTSSAPTTGCEFYSTAPTKPPPRPSDWVAALPHYHWPVPLTIRSIPCSSPFRPFSSEHRARSDRTRFVLPAAVCVHPATAKTKPRSTIHPAKHTNTHQPLGRGWCTERTHSVHQCAR